jgi:uncharacterized protein YijF (DUF1287 family)
MRTWAARGQGVLVLLFACAVGLASAQTTVLDANSHQIFLQKLVAAAIERTHHVVRYDSSYVRIPYPGGDVPEHTGVCTDEVIRAYRALGVDLQKQVHEDMIQNFSAYPHNWKWLSSGPDSNIDHRRVPNLMVSSSAKASLSQLVTKWTTIHPEIW